VDGGSSLFGGEDSEGDGLFSWEEIADEGLSVVCLSDDVCEFFVPECCAEAES